MCIDCKGADAAAAAKRFLAICNDKTTFAMHGLTCETYTGEIEFITHNCIAHMGDILYTWMQKIK
jgi:hypothetical protein